MKSLLFFSSWIHLTAHYSTYPARITKPNQTKPDHDHDHNPLSFYSFYPACGFVTDGWFSRLGTARFHIRLVGLVRPLLHTVDTSMLYARIVSRLMVNLYVFDKR
jgi:hypothetical protein